MPGCGVARGVVTEHACCTIVLPAVIHRHVGRVVVPLGMLNCFWGIAQLVGAAVMSSLVHHDVEHSPDFVSLSCVTSPCCSLVRCVSITVCHVMVCSLFCLTRIRSDERTALRSLCTACGLVPSCSRGVYCTRWSFESESRSSDVVRLWW